MAEIVSSAIVGEAVSRIFSGIATSISKDEGKLDEEAAGGGLERLEMARIKMEAAVETSGKWQITDASLLRWRKKLKRAAQDCDDAARRCRRQLSWEQEDEVARHSSSFPRRIAHATKAFVSSFVRGNNDDDDNSSSNNNDHCSPSNNSVAVAVRRFERFADGAGEFMRFVQLGGTPRRQHLFFDPLIGHIFAGETLLYQVSYPGGQYHCFGIRPMCFEDRGLEAMMSFTYEDWKVPKNSFRLGFMLRLSESTNIIGTVVECLRLVTPHFKFTTDIIIKEITQLPTQDFTCVPPEVVNPHVDHWNNIHNTLTGWFRPDPLCCQGYEYDDNATPSRHNNSSSGTKLSLSSIFPEPVSQVFLQRHISLSEYNNLPPGSTGATADSDNMSSLENSSLLKLGIMFMPHDTLKEDLGEGGSAIEAINGEKQQHLTHVNVHPDQLDEMLLPKAIDYLSQNSEATTYQMCWRSNHGSAHLCVEKTSRIIGAGRATRRGRNIKSTNKLLYETQQQYQKMMKVYWKQAAEDCLKLWVVRSSESLRSSFLAWLKQ